MQQIRPISDLQTHFHEIKEQIIMTGEPAILTNHGYGEMVLMSLHEYEKMKFAHEVECKLAEADWQSQNTTLRYTHAQVFDDLEKELEKSIQKG